MSIWLSGCAIVGQEYRRPESVLPPAHWEAALPHGGSRLALNAWWQKLQDPTLSGLLEATLTRHPGLEGAQAAIESARAALRMQEAGDQPTARTSGQLQQAGHPTANPNAATMTSRAVAVDAGWELDLFGRVQRATEGALAKVAARSAEWHSLKITLAAETASLYNELRTCERLTAALNQEAASRQTSHEVTRVATRAGLTAPAESAVMQARVAEVLSRLAGQQAECALTIKGLVALTGLAEPEMRTRLHARTGQPLNAPMLTVTTLPMQLLAQRPDLAAYEQELVAANAEIGVAEAARFPRMSLLGNIGIGVISSSGRGSQEVQSWSFGPALSWPVLDGGIIEAGVTAARARHAMALASYRAKVREAVREVESVLVNLEASQRRLEEARNLVQGMTLFRQAAEENWRTGGINRLTLEEARRQQLEAERSKIQLEGRQMQYWINLYKALGGGWGS
ncbi:MAG: efflux transporter outer membrane subunit [Magnetococcales bacterium]|nr:efflux transporter outer membrane subunit [Magnetococcales bacterium]